MGSSLGGGKQTEGHNKYSASTEYQYKMCTFQTLTWGIVSVLGDCGVYKTCILEYNRHCSVHYPLTLKDYTLFGALPAVGTDAPVLILFV